MDYNGYLTYQPSNYNRLFNDKMFISRLIEMVKVKIGRHLNKTEKMAVINILKNINPVIFKGENYKTILSALTAKISEDIIKTPCYRDEDINIHEMLKSELGVATEDAGPVIKTETDFAEQITSTFSTQVEVTSLLGNKTLTDLQRLINPELVKKNIYILLDTRYRLLENDGTTYFKWNFINTEINAQGAVNAIGNIRDITSLRIYPVRIPYNTNGDNDYDRITIFIQEFSAQSFIAQENRRFHFMFNPTTTDRWIDLAPDYFNDGYFRFRNPITRLETLTLTFGSPLEQMTFDTDRMLTSISSYITQINNIYYITFTTTSAHNLETGDRVYISNFTTENPSTDNIVVSAVNRSNGHIISIVDDFNFNINVNGTSLRTLGSGTINVVNGSPIITGSGTVFGSTFNVNDKIEILGVFYKILSIQSHVQLTLTTNYLGLSLMSLSYYRNNIIYDLRPTAYFGSKRIFIAMEVEYFSSDA